MSLAGSAAGHSGSTLTSGIVPTALGLQALSRFRSNSVASQEEEEDQKIAAGPDGLDPAELLRAAKA